MSYQPIFIEELADFLRPWEPVFFTLEAVPSFSSFCFRCQKLMIHCIPLSDSMRGVPASVFVEITEKYATEGIKVIHLWEDVWHSKKPIVQSRLQAALGQSQRIPARLTQVRRIDKPTLDNFLEKNHLQMPTTAKYKYGLFLPKKYERILNKAHSLIDSLAHSDEVLVAVASFSGGKNILRDGFSSRSFELIRFANVLNCTVVGGLDKLIKAFTRELNPDDIMTYADRDWSDGHSYQRLGFTRVEATPPQAFWVNPDSNERYYTERLEVNEVPENWMKVYNSGNWKFLKRLKAGE